jgi:hypothetical protein
LVADPRSSPPPSTTGLAFAPSLAADRHNDATRRITTTAGISHQAGTEAWARI